MLGSDQDTGKSTKLPTPEYFACVTNSRFRHNVYEPEADTFLLLDALEKDKELLWALQPKRCLEVGCGSGTVITFLHTLFAYKPSQPPPYRNTPPTNSIDGTVSSSNNADVHDGEVLSFFLSRQSPTPPSPSFTFSCREMCFIAVDVNPIALEAAEVTWSETGKKQFGLDTFKVKKRLVREHASGETNDSTVCPDALRANEQRVEVVNSEVEVAAVGASATNIRDDSTHQCILHLLEGDLFTPVDHFLSSFSLEGLECSAERGNEKTCDVILFNPPYVPTSMEELEDAIQKKDVITAAWCGGSRGRVVLDRFLLALPLYLSCPGVCYIVLIRENDVEDVKRFVLDAFACQATLRKQQKQEEEEEEEVTFETVVERYTGEHLGVYRIKRERPTSHFHTVSN